MKPARIVLMLMAAAVAAFTVARPATGQSFDSSIIDRSVKGMVAVSSSIIADTFTPMTHYGAGDWTATVVPVYIGVDRVYEDPELKGDGLRGYAGAAGAGYALNDRFMVYAIYAGAALDGAVTGRYAYGSIAADFSMDVEYRFHGLFAGAGYDLVGGGGAWSVPLYLGVSIQRYDVSIDYPYSNTLAGYSQRVDVSGAGVLYGVTAALAVSRNLGWFRLTPYFLYSHSFNRPELRARVHQEITFPSATYDISRNLDTNRVTAYMPGFQVSFLGDSSWSVSLCLGGLISSYTGFINEGLANGLKVRTVAVAFTMRGGRNGG